MEITRLPALSDNYIFLLFDPQKKIAAVVDPAEAQPVLNCLNRLNAELVAIFNTHHHADHVGGNNSLIRHYPNLCVYASEQDQGRIPGQTVFLKEGDQVEFSDRKAEIYFIPGHKGDILLIIFRLQTQKTQENYFVEIPFLREVVDDYLREHRNKWLIL